MYQNNQPNYIKSKTNSNVILKYFLHERNYFTIKIKFHTKTQKNYKKYTQNKKAIDLHTILLKFNKLQYAYQ